MALIDSYSEANYTSASTLYAGSNIARGQSFTNTNESILTSCKFYTNKTGSPTGSVYAKLYAHTGTFGQSSGVPTGAPLATSDAVDITTINASLALQEFTFSTPYTMQAGTYYCITMHYNGGDADNNIGFGLDGTPEHGGSSNRSTNESSWIGNSNQDAIFYVYGGEIASVTLSPLILSVTLPAVTASSAIVATATPSPILLEITLPLVEATGPIIPHIRKKQKMWETHVWDGQIKESPKRTPVRKKKPQMGTAVSPAKGGKGFMKFPMPKVKRKLPKFKAKITY